MSHAHTTYHDPADLPRLGEIGEHAPELARKFLDWCGAVCADGAPSARAKSLVARGAAFAVRCPNCIDAYTQDSRAKCCDAERGTEVAHVWAAIRGRAVLAHGVKMRNVASKLSM